MVEEKDNRKYLSNQFTYGHLKNKFKLPNFQRRLVWSDKQKREFIDTLSSGFPFGSILIYKYPNTEELSLIDGLQRISTMSDYERAPEKYIDIQEEVKRLINNLIISEKDQNDVRFIKMLEKKLEDVLKSVLKKNDPTPYFLLDLIKNIEELVKYIDVNEEREITNLQHDLIQKKKNYLDVDNIDIPAIEFLGNEDELAKVFENLNKGGVKLTKYQVFAAQWSNHTYVLNDKTNNQKLLEIIIDKYINLNESRDIKIENFSPDEMRDEKSVNLSELCYGIGKLILDVSPVFYSNKKSDQLESLADEIGYSTMAIIFGVDNKKLHTLRKQAGEVLNADLIEELIEKIIKIYSNINDHFAKYLKIPRSENTYENKLISNFKFLSYFADLWANNFNITKNSEVKDKSTGQDHTYSKSLNNFIYYYLIDAATNNWGNAGDSRLNNFYLDKSRTYSIRPEKAYFEDTLKYWWKERLLSYSINFDSISKLILTVYYNKIQNNGLVEGRDHDFEHIVVRKKLRDRYKDLNIPGGTLGNMMFLDSSLNKRKKDLNLYKIENSGENINKSYKKIALYPEEKDIYLLETSLEKNQPEKTINFITKRGYSILEKLTAKMY